MSLLKVENLNIHFKTEDGDFHAVKGINLALKKGEIIGLVGESGSGKSVSSLALMRLLDKNSRTEGKVFFEGTNLLDLSEKEMQAYRGNRIAMIFQEPMTSLNPVITCGKQVAETILIHQKKDKQSAKQKTIQLFQEVKLPDPEYIYDKYPHELSGGQKQRVMIAMALACDPAVLIADEPTTALDVTVQKSILDLLFKLKTERNMSLIFISHDLGVIGEIADQVLVMYKGEIVEHGNIEQVFLNPQHPYTRGLLSCRPSPELQLSRLPVINDFILFENGKMESSGLVIDKLKQQYQIDPSTILSKREKLYQQEPLLQVKDLKTWFSKKGDWWKKEKEFVKAVDEVSFEVFPGETFGLVGESGCGKTTLSRTILKLIEPTSGEILFNGQNISELTAKEMRPLRKDIQIIFQDPYSSLNPIKTIGDALTEPLLVHQIFKNQKERKDFVIDLMEKVGLTAAQFNRYPHEFSGGQRQRVVIARALSLQPKLIICDESVSALDVSVQAQVLNLLKDLQQQFNLTYIFISHDMAVVKHMADRMMVMNKGKIEELGYPEDIYNHPQKEYTQKLVNAIPKGIFAKI
ncbi:MAG: ABC transporter ATP-binding protein [Bacteroidetes bacterium]|nr:ABC transporter ATP-binding protein [Bacteroidota bacterium]MBU1484971.1 ABC transporter ATP-binding protein [Bacteroidota bacterium]MBU2266676.1 ABC transporter ATP-binding protein [Bacteroidota bacterium]MBU2374876.1 ABC transporter ATP-binding protein [Bacteroidota bacterium]